MTLRYIIVAIFWLIGGAIAIWHIRKDLPGPLAPIARTAFFPIMFLAGPIGGVIAVLMCLPPADNRPLLAGPAPATESF